MGSVIGEAFGRVIKQRQAVKLLDTLTGADPEADHAAADEAILLCVPDDVRKAYERAKNRCGSWDAW